MLAANGNFFLKPAAERRSAEKACPTSPPALPRVDLGQRLHALDSTERQ
jgi:hypothetical protein